MFFGMTCAEAAAIRDGERKRALVNKRIMRREMERNPSRKFFKPKNHKPAVFVFTESGCTSLR